MTNTLASWHIAEPLGLSWNEQVVTHPLHNLKIPPHTPLCVCDDLGTVRAAQQVRDHLFYITDLPAHTKKNLHLKIGKSEPTSLQLKTNNTHLELTHAQFGIRIAWAETPIRYQNPRALTNCPPPIAQICGPQKIWFGQGHWQTPVPCHGFQCEIIYDGPVVASVKQTYALQDGEISFVYHIDAVSPDVHIDVISTHEGLQAIWQFDDFAPTHAFWRPHSTDAWRGEKTADNHHRQTYVIQQTTPPDDLFLQPFYNWHRNGAMFWSCWSESTHTSDVLLLGAIRPSKTKSKGPFQPHYIRNGKQLSITTQNGCTTLAIGMLSRSENTTTPTPHTTHIENLYRHMHSLDLNAYLHMDMAWLEHEMRHFPRLFIAPKDKAQIQEQAKNCHWFYNAFQNHVNDQQFFSNTQPTLKINSEHAPLGRDLAGAYLVSANEQYAQQAFAHLHQQLQKWVHELGTLGPTVDACIGFAFAGPFRSAIITFDFIADALTPQARLSCLQHITFLTEVFFSKDAWPDTDSGLSRGNLNFHANVISARGLAAALLQGHPKQNAWLTQTHQEAAAFLRQYHFDGGCARESLTYQFNAIAQFTLLSIALHRAGHDDLFETEPLFKQSFDFLASVQTPHDPRVGFCMLPTVGHVTSYGWGQSLQACFAWAAKATAQTDKTFSAHMMAAWKRAGSPVFSWHDFYHGQIWWPPLCLIDPTLPHKTALQKSGLYPGLGAIFRSPKTEGYVLVKMGPSRGHYDPDEGSILWYAWGKPILADFGCQYNPNIECAWLHNRISFDHWNETNDHAFQIESYTSGPQADTLRGTMTITRLHRWADRPIRTTDFDFRSLPPPHTIEPITWQRDILYVRDCETILIHDHINGQQKTDWNLQVFANAIDIKGNRATCRGQFGIDLDVCMTHPPNTEWSVGSFEHLGFDEPRLPAWWWRGANWMTSQGATYGPVGERALTLHTPASVQPNYLAILMARPKDHAPSQIDPLPNGFAWQTNMGKWHAQFMNNQWRILHEESDPK